MSTAQIDAARYASWFAWAEDTLGRDLEAAHAAAEAGCTHEQAGWLRDPSESAARSAGAAPTLVDPRTMALAEWAFWARNQLQLSPADALRAANQAIAVVEATHSLEAAIASAIALSPTPETQQHTNSAAPRTAGFWRRYWPAVAGLMVISALIAAAATAGILRAVTSTTTITAPAPTVAVAVDPGSGAATVTVAGFPPDHDFYVILDGSPVGVVHTDGSGFGTVLIKFPLGGHTVRACIEPTGDTCLGSAFATRSQQ
jgi:hypothetical protein